MSDWRAEIKKLDADVVPKLNDAAALAVSEILACEAEMLTMGRNPKLAVYVQLPSGYLFGWDACGGRWHFTFKLSSEDDRPAGRMSHDAPRPVRIEAAQRLDILMRAICQRVEQLLATAKTS